VLDQAGGSEHTQSERGIPTGTNHVTIGPSTTSHAEDVLDARIRKGKTT